MRNDAYNSLPYILLNVYNHTDPRTAAMIDELGPLSEWISVKIKCLILSECHYLVWDKFHLRLLAKQTGATEELVMRTLDWLLDNGIYDRRLFDEEGVLTGVEIQRYFFTVTSRRKDSAERRKYRLWYAEGEEPTCAPTRKTAAKTTSECTQKSELCKQPNNTVASKSEKAKNTSCYKSDESNIVASNCTQLLPNREVKGREVKGSNPDCLSTMQDLNYKKNGGLQVNFGAYSDARVDVVGARLATEARADVVGAGLAPPRTGLMPPRTGLAAGAQAATGAGLAPP